MGWTPGAAAQVPARQSPPSGPAVLVLDVQLNGEARGSVLVLESGGTYYIAEDDARAWRLRARGSAALQYRERRYLALEALGLRLEQLDRAALQLVLSAPPEAFETTQLGLQGLDYPVTPAAVGGFFNYDLLGSRFSGRGVVDGAFELGAFAPFGVFTHQFVQRNLASSRTPISATNASPRASAATGPASCNRSNSATRSAARVRAAAPCASAACSSSATSRCARDSSGSRCRC